MPAMPHSAAGPRIEPPVSEPVPPRIMPDATAAPVPDDEPAVKCSGFHGLRAGGQGRSKDGPPMANSCVASLPISTVPAAAHLRTDGRILRRDIVLQQLASARSCGCRRCCRCPCGRSGCRRAAPSHGPAIIRASAARASASARSSVSRMKACSVSSSALHAIQAVLGQLDRRQLLRRDQLRRPRRWWGSVPSTHLRDEHVRRFALQRHRRC